MSVSNQYYVYILFSKKNGTLYVGVTSDLVKRVWQHKNKLVKGFTQKYSVDKLGYYEVSNDINSAIAREKQLKGGSRKAKLDLIEINNPNWNDLCHCERSEAIQPFLLIVIKMLGCFVGKPLPPRNDKDYLL